MAISDWKNGSDWRLAISDWWNGFWLEGTSPDVPKFFGSAGALPSRKAALNLAKSYDLLAKMADESLQEY